MLWYVAGQPFWAPAHNQPWELRPQGLLQQRDHMPAVQRRLVLAPATGAVRQTAVRCRLL